METERLDDFYRIQSRFYDLTRPFFLLDRKRALSSIQFNRRDQVLDLACGTGMNIPYISSVVDRDNITGIDYSESMLKKARHKFPDVNFVRADVLPEEKEEKIKELQKKSMVAFVGDGINDAPALKQSNVGIAMGSGTDIAIEAGDIVLTRGSLEGVVKAIDLSDATFGKIKQNLFWAFAYNIIAVPLAILGLLHPAIAEVAMALSSITVVGNANLLRRKKI